MSLRSRRVDDPLWKSILEQTFSHFLRFIFPNADAVFDLSKPFDYLDKEFEQLFPPESNGKGVRYVDKLVKVFLKDGSEFMAILNKKVTDEGLKEIKHDLYDEMMKREMDKDTRQGLYDYH